MNTEEKALTALAAVVERHTAHRDGYQVMVTLGTLRAIAAALREARQQEREMVEGEIVGKIIAHLQKMAGADVGSHDAGVLLDVAIAIRNRDWKHSAGTGEG